MDFIDDADDRKVDIIFYYKKRTAHTWKRNQTFWDDLSLKMIFRQGVEIASNERDRKMETFKSLFFYPFVIH